MRKRIPTVAFFLYICYIIIIFDLLIWKTGGLPVKRKIIVMGLLAVFLVGAGIALYNILDISLEYRAGEKTYENVRQFVQVETAPEREEAIASAPASQESTAASEPVMEPVRYPEVDFGALLDINDDVVGWVYIEDTKINYPVVQGEDNRYYISTMVDGKYNSAGSVFMDYHNASDFSDWHTILYGHNMQNGTMLNGITLYRNQEYYDAHPLGLIITPQKKFQFEIVSAYIASLADPAWQLEFVDDADALQWLEDSMERAPFVSRYKPRLGDRILTLSTCTYEFNDARFVLVGVLREDIQ